MFGNFALNISYMGQLVDTYILVKFSKVDSCRLTVTTLLAALWVFIRRKWSAQLTSIIVTSLLHQIHNTSSWS